MSASTDRWIVPVSGGWVVQRQDRSRVSQTFELQVDAVQHAEEVMASHGGGVLVILGRDGHPRHLRTIGPRPRRLQRA
ncbi:MAG: hypothetical protein QOE05_1986 [Actinomycetota bacterium]|nr:hypothetical protein [Actinomycetota bacterium]